MGAHYTFHAPTYGHIDVPITTVRRGLSRINSSSPPSLISALLRLRTTSYRSMYKKMKSIERRSGSGRLRKMTVAVKALVEQ